MTRVGAPQLRGLLLDFDGPLTDLMPYPINAQAADRARAALSPIELPGTIVHTTDHLSVLRYAQRHHPDQLVAVVEACTQAEIEAARIAEPSPHFHDLITYARTEQIHLAIVSNNAPEAVRTFLDKHSQGQPIVLACRDPHRPERMKPEPDLLIDALEKLQLDPSSVLFIGDSSSDAQAARQAQVTMLGLAKNDQRARDLKVSGAAHVLDLGDREGTLELLQMGFARCP